MAVPGAETYRVGFGEKLGLYRPIAASGDVSQIMTKATADTAWTVTAAVYRTVRFLCATM